jgi:hypothetical protein
LHVPPEQTWPASHVVPQVPQFAPSVASATHASPPPVVGHTDWPVPHVVAHAPSAHCWPAAQAVPQVPQLALSVLPSAQYAGPVPESVSAAMAGAHVSSPLAQLVAHAPPEQTWPAAHVLPHAPQLALSVASVTQAPPHTAWPEGQLVPHAPETHASEAPHTVPQAPQSSCAVRTSTQPPPHATRAPVHCGPVASAPSDASVAIATSAVEASAIASGVDASADRIGWSPEPESLEHAYTPSGQSPQSKPIVIQFLMAMILRAPSRGGQALTSRETSTSAQMAS